MQEYYEGMENIAATNEPHEECNGPENLEVQREEKVRKVQRIKRKKRSKKGDEENIDSTSLVCLNSNESSNTIKHIKYWNQSIFITRKKIK